MLFRSTISNTKLNDVYATLNGLPLTPSIAAFRQSCDGQPNLNPPPPGTDGAFDANVQDDSLLAFLGATNSPDELFASDGYWLMLQPLAVGTYELKFGGTFNDGGFVQNNNYTLHVFNASVPGPLPVLGVTAGFCYSRKLRTRMKSRS